MAIPTERLTAWTSIGPQVNSTRTYNSVKAALGEVSWPVNNPISIHLQGSYRNDTNIRGESDVDIVVRTTNVWQRDIGALSPAEKEAYLRAHMNATYTWDHLYADTLAGLQRSFGQNKVQVGNKAIKVETPYLRADVIPCLEYRRYSRFLSRDEALFDAGVTFRTRANNRWIINYPEEHYKNGVAKNRRTDENYKPTVRMFKNANAYMVETGRLAESAAFSYAIECMVYSAPDECFTNDVSQTYCAIVNWVSADNIPLIRRVSEMGPLVGVGPEQWSPANAAQFLDGLVDLWNNW